MTREEAIKSLQNIIEYWTYKPTEVEAAKMAIAALRPVSREQVEKMKKEPVEGDKCPECGFENIGSGNFCRNCGCLYTDKAVDMVMERLEALRDGKGD